MIQKNMILHLKMEEKEEELQIQIDTLAVVDMVLVDVKDDEDRLVDRKEEERRREQNLRTILGGKVIIMMALALVTVWDMEMVHPIINNRTITHGQVVVDVPDVVVRWVVVLVMVRISNTVIIGMMEVVMVAVVTMIDILRLRLAEIMANNDPVFNGIVPV